MVEKVPTLINITITIENSSLPIFLELFRSIPSAEQYVIDKVSPADLYSLTYILKGRRTLTAVCLDKMCQFATMCQF